MLWHLCMIIVLTSRPALYLSTGHARLGLGTMCGGIFTDWQQVSLLRQFAGTEHHMRVQQPDLLRRQHLPTRRLHLRAGQVHSGSALAHGNTMEIPTQI